MTYVWIAVAAIVACLSGALWWENGRAADLAREVGRRDAEIERLTGAVKDAKEVADTNKRLANWWRDETVRSGELIAEAEARAARAQGEASNLLLEVNRAKGAAERVPDSYAAVHRWLRERGAAGAPGAHPAGAGRPPGAPGPDFHPSAYPPAARRGQQR